MSRHVRAPSRSAQAMKVAKEQAAIREKASAFAKEGLQVPEDLVRKYNKALRQKLGRGRAAPDDSPPPKERDENQDPASNNSKAAPAEPIAAALTTYKPAPGNSVVATQGEPSQQAPPVQVQGQVQGQGQAPQQQAPPQALGPKSPESRSHVEGASF